MSAAGKKQTMTNIELQRIIKYRHGHGMNGQSIYVVVPYWLFYLNLKLSSAKLSHFSEICRAFMQNNVHISWSQREEGWKERGPLLLFNLLVSILQPATKN